MSAPAAKPKRARTLSGVVVAVSGAKTVRVRIERRTIHPLYGKVIRRRTDLLANDATNAYQRGDKVVIQERRPLSKRKSWEVIGRQEARR